MSPGPIMSPPPIRSPLSSSSLVPAIWEFDRPTKRGGGLDWIVLVFKNLPSSKSTFYKVHLIIKSYKFWLKNSSNTYPMDIIHPPVYPPITCEENDLIWAFSCGADADAGWKCQRNSPNLHWRRWTFYVHYMSIIAFIRKGIEFHWLSFCCL